MSRAILMGGVITVFLSACGGAELAPVTRSFGSADLIIIYNTDTDSLTADFSGLGAPVFDLVRVPAADKDGFLAFKLPLEPYYGYAGQSTDGAVFASVFGGIGPGLPDWSVYSGGIYGRTADGSLPTGGNATFSGD